MCTGMICLVANEDRLGITHIFNNDTTSTKTTTFYTN